MTKKTKSKDLPPIETKVKNKKPLNNLFDVYDVDENLINLIRSKIADCVNNGDVERALYYRFFLYYLRTGEGMNEKEVAEGLKILAELDEKRKSNKEKEITSKLSYFFTLAVCIVSGILIPEYPRAVIIFVMALSFLLKEKLNGSFVEKILKLLKIMSP